MKQYLSLLQDILDNGENSKVDRTGAGTKGVFQRQIRHNLENNFPLLTTKRVSFKSISVELDWFLTGGNNVKYLIDRGVNIWSSDTIRFNMDYIVNDFKLFSQKEVKSAQNDAKKGNIKPARELIKTFNNEIKTNEEFAEIAGNMGPTYGPQWRGTNGAIATDQIKELEDALNAGGTSRRMLVDAWNSKQVKEVALPWCHPFWQVRVSPEGQKLTLGWTQRSCDTVLGVPYNLASYALMAERLAHAHGFEKGEVDGNLGDVHIYRPHILAVKEQLLREPRELPKHSFKQKFNSVVDYTYENSHLENYNPHPKLENPTPMFGGLF